MTISVQSYFEAGNVANTIEDGIFGEAAIDDKLDAVDSDRRFCNVGCKNHLLLVWFPHKHFLLLFRWLFAVKGVGNNLFHSRSRRLDNADELLASPFDLQQPNVLSGC